MATEVIMPKVDMVMETGTFVEWLKKEGEHVNKGEPLFVITTEKAAIELESPGDGILAGVTAKPDDVIPVTEVMAYILAPGEALPTKAAAQPVSPASAPAPAKVEQVVEMAAAPAVTGRGRARCEPLRLPGEWRRNWGWIYLRSQAAVRRDGFTKPTYLP